MLLGIPPLAKRRHSHDVALKARRFAMLFTVQPTVLRMEPLRIITYNHQEKTSYTLASERA